MVETHRITATALSAAIAWILSVPAANACSSPKQLEGPFAMEQLRVDSQNPLESVSFASLVRDLSNGSEGNRASIVGMWSIQFLSSGNTTHNPPIPDGAVIDFGYAQYHSDGTENVNSGGSAPAAQNYCLGIWEKTGPFTYKVNHFAFNYDAKTGLLTAKVNITETITLSPGGSKYSGTFKFNFFDTKGNEVDHVTGQVAATRITIDTTTP
jgi:hypothetical protein